MLTNSLASNDRDTLSYPSFMMSKKIAGPRDRRYLHQELIIQVVPSSQVMKQQNASS